MITAIIAMFVGSSLGAAATWFLTRRRPTTVHAVPVGRGAAVPLPVGLPALGDDQCIWLVPDDVHQRQAAEALARALAQERTVLLAPRPSSRAWLAERFAGERQVMWLEDGNPTCERLILAAEALPPSLRVVVLVEGAQALEEPSADEPTDAVVQELLQLSELPTVVLLSELDRLPVRPTLRLRATDEGLTTDDGQLVVRFEGEGGRLAEG
jgi:hypothetical protein